jgi:hypothetical protein
MRRSTVLSLSLQPVFPEQMIDDSVEEPLLKGKALYR